MGADVVYNPLDPGVRRDPYGCYAEMRAAGPVLWNPLLSMWTFPRYAEVWRLLKEPTFSARRVEGIIQRNPTLDDDGAAALRKLLSGWMLFQDSPDHVRLRSLVSRAFTPTFVAELRPRVERLCAELLAPAIASGEADIMAAVANPLPFEVIAEMLGIPAGERVELRRWSDGIATLLGSLRPDEAIGREAVRCVGQLGDYLGGVIADRRARPADDLITHLVEAEEEGGRLSADEVLATCALLFLAGHETTTNLIGNGLLALLNAPDQLAELRADPGLAPRAVEELLRFDSPVQFLTRIATEPVEVAGVTVEPGQRVLLFLGSAHRDGDVFDDPDRLDVTREECPHVAFGRGAHFCLGAALARLEGEVVFRALLDRCASIELAADPAELDWRPDIGFRGVRSLPVRLVAR